MRPIPPVAPPTSCATRLFDCIQRLTRFNLQVNMILQLVCWGIWRVYAICNARADCALLDFLQGVDRGGALARDKRRMLADLERVAHTFLPPNDAEISHQVDRKEGIWQFTRGGVRILWFY